MTSKDFKPPWPTWGTHWYKLDPPMKAAGLWEEYRTVEMVGPIDYVLSYYTSDFLFAIYLNGDGIPLQTHPLPRNWTYGLMSKV